MLQCAPESTHLYAYGSEQVLSAPKKHEHRHSRSASWRPCLSRSVAHCLATQAGCRSRAKYNALQ